MLFIGVLTLLASLFASWLKQFPGFSLFGALIIALLIGMITPSAWASNPPYPRTSRPSRDPHADDALSARATFQFPIRSAYVGSNDGRKAGVKDAAGLISNKLLRLGIILLGFKLNLAVLFTQGIKCLPIAAVVVTLTIIVCYAIARKLGVDPMLAILTAGGTGICGAAAVMGLAGSIKVPEDKTGMTKDQLGITAGASLHEIAHAVAGGDAFGAVDIATIMKLSRVLMLVFAAIIIAIWWEKKHSEVQSTGKKTVAFPWFMLGFIGASIIGTFVPFVTSITPQLVDFAYIVLGMAMAALGINVNFKAIASKGKKPMLASFLTSILLMCFAAGVAVLFF